MSREEDNFEYNLVSKYKPKRRIKIKVKVKSIKKFNPKSYIL